MKSSFKDIPNLGAQWDFWFSHTTKLPKSDISKKKENYYFILNIETSEIDYVNVQVSNGLGFNEHFRYSFHYSYRVKTANGSFITIKQQYHAIEVDDNGHMLKTIVMQERIDDYIERPPDDFKIFDILKNRPINLPSRFKLSKREIEILELVCKGYKSNEISEMLYLSKHTINTHRKNILSKTSSASLIELIKKV